MKNKKSPHLEDAGKTLRWSKNTKKRRRVVFPEYQLRDIYSDNRILVWERGVIWEQ